MPIIPIYWYTYVQLERTSIKDTYNLNLLDQVDLTKVKVAGLARDARRAERARRGTGSPRLARKTPTPAGIDLVVGFIIRRLLWTIPVLLLVILMTFLMMRHIQGNPFRHSERAVSPEIQANLDRKFNLDKPWYVQYLLYVKGVATFDLGPSLVLRNQSVNDIVKEHFPKSLELGFLAMVFAVVSGSRSG